MTLAHNLIEQWNNTFMKEYQILLLIANMYVCTSYIAEDKKGALYTATAFVIGALISIFINK